MLFQKNCGKNNHKKLLLDLLQRSEVSILCSGWLKHDGLVELLPSIDYGLSNQAAITVYSNAEHTDEKAIATIACRPEIKHFLVSKQSRYLHTKLYYFQRGDEYTAIIGSANITYGGLVRNEELSVRMEGGIDDIQHRQILEYLNGLRKL